MLNLQNKIEPIDTEAEITPELERKVLFSLLEDVSAEKQALSQQTKVSFSILEDINEAQEELKGRYADLYTLKNLVQELGASLKTTVVLQKLTKALKQTLPESSNFAYVIPSPDPRRPSNLVYVHTQTSLGKEYLDSIKENIVLSFDLVPTRVKRREELVRWIRGKFLFEFIEGTQSPEGQANGAGNDYTKQPLSSFNVPLIVRDEILGTINISSPEPDLFTEKDINLANTMVGVTASTISRLRQLLESEQSRIQSLVESLSDGVIMFDVDRRVTMSNPAAQKMAGLPAKGFYLSELTKLFTSAAAAAAEKGLLEVFDKKISQALDTGEFTFIPEVNLSRFSYEVYISPIHDHEKKIIGGAIILHDITHLKEIDRMKTEFVSVASHQLRTPLTPIKLFSEMLLNGEVGELNPKQKEYIEDISQSTKRMIKLVNDLLNVSRIETGRLKIEPKLTQIEDFIQSIIKEAKPVADSRKDRIIFKKPKSKLPKIPVDPTLMRQVIHNLITNAIRYSPKKQCDIVVTLAQKNHDYLVSVEDSGIGIPKDVQSRIFEKFFRADNAMKAEAEGSGLGMYVAKMIMEASNGKVWFESPPKGEKNGTIFYVSIPAGGMMKKEGEKGLAGEALII